MAGPSLRTWLIRLCGYTHRVAISNQRLLSFDGRCVRFRWKDYAHGHKQRIMTLTAFEFLRRFCQRVLPRGFVRIRHFGYLANARRTALLALARQQLLASLHEVHIPPTPRSRLGLFALRRQHAHRAPRHRATTGITMRPSRHFLIPTLYTGRRRCGSTSRPPLSSVRNCEFMTCSCLQAVHEIARP